MFAFIHELLFGRHLRVDRNLRGDESLKFEQRQQEKKQRLLEHLQQDLQLGNVWWWCVWWFVLLKCLCVVNSKCNKNNPTVLHVLHVEYTTVLIISRELLLFTDDCSF